jgi:acyl-coenzyme A thioesterase PaaI-like protein
MGGILQGMLPFLQRVATAVGYHRFLRLLRFWPPYVGAGISVVHVAKDLSVLEVEMKLTPFNRNFVGTQFGGSLYAMCDPFFMLMIMMSLGDDYVVWDKSATIEFLKPGRGRVRARFEVPPALLARLKQETDAAGKINPKLEATVLDEEGQAIARVTKVLSIRRKDRKNLTAVPSDGARA